MAQNDGNNNSNVNTKNVDESLLSLKGCKEWLEQQKLDYEAELNSMRKVEQDELEGHREPNMEELCESILQLQEQLLEVSSNHSTKQYILQRLLSSYVKMKVLFSTTDPETGSSVPNEEDFAYQVDEQQRLCKDIQKYQQALEEEQVTLRDLERQRTEATRINEKLSTKLQELQMKKQTSKTEKESKTETSLRKQILERQNMIEVARNICQALIFGSDVDWTEDEELREMVLSFGQPIDLLDT